MLKDKKVVIFISMLMVIIAISLYPLYGNLKGSVVNYDKLQKNTDDEINIKYNDVLTQSFYSSKNQLFSVDLMVSNKDTIKVEYGIEDYNTSEVLYKNEISLPSIPDKNYYQFTIPELTDSKDNSYIFYIKNLEDKEGLRVWKSNSDLYGNGVLKMNNNELTGDVSFRIDFNDKYPYVYKILFAIFILTLMILLGAFIQKRYFVSLEKSFLALALVFGTFMTFFVPPAQVPDEIVHFFRAYEISQGDFIPSKNGVDVGSNMPEAVLSFIKVGDYERIPTKYNEKVDIDDFTKSSKLYIDNNRSAFISVGGASIYIPIQYFPQSLGILIGRILNLPIISIFYLGRLVNMLVWVMMSYLALKIIPFGKKILFLAALMPMVIQQAASMSPDGMLIGISFLFTSYCLQLAYVKDRVDNKDIIKIIIMSLAIVSMKVIYTPIILLVTLINSKKFKRRRDLILLVIGMVVVGVLANVLWFNAVSYSDTFKTPSDKINAVEQVKFVLSHPLKYIMVLFNTFMQLSKSYIESAVGILGWLDYSLPYPIMYSYIFILIFSSIVNEEKEEFKVTNIHRGILIFTSVSVIILVISSLYASWTDVGAKIVNGVQGRYFIPIILCLLLSFVNNKIMIKSKNLYQYLIGYEIFIFAYTIIAVISRYYITLV